MRTIAENILAEDITFLPILYAGIPGARMQNLGKNGGPAGKAPKSNICERFDCSPAARVAASPGPVAFPTEICHSSGWEPKWRPEGPGEDENTEAISQAVDLLGGHATGRRAIARRN